MGWDHASLNAPRSRGSPRTAASAWSPCMAAPGSSSIPASADWDFIGQVKARGRYPGDRQRRYRDRGGRRRSAAPLRRGRADDRSRLLRHGRGSSPRWCTSCAPARVCRSRRWHGRKPWLQNHYRSILDLLWQPCRRSSGPQARVLVLARPARVGRVPRRDEPVDRCRCGPPADRWLLRPPDRPRCHAHARRAATRCWRKRHDQSGRPAPRWPCANAAGRPTSARS